MLEPLEPLKPAKLSERRRQEPLAPLEPLNPPFRIAQNEPERIVLAEPIVLQVKLVEPVGLPGRLELEPAEQVCPYLFRVG